MIQFLPLVAGLATAAIGDLLSPNSTLFDDQNLGPKPGEPVSQPPADPPNPVNPTTTPKSVIRGVPVSPPETKSIESQKDESEPKPVAKPKTEAKPVGKEEDNPTAKVSTRKKKEKVEAENE